MSNPSVGIIMGSQSDLKIMQEAAEVLEDLKVPFELTVVSAHRTPERMYEYGSTAVEKGLKVIIAGAGVDVVVAGTAPDAVVTGVAIEIVAGE